MQIIKETDQITNMSIKWAVENKSIGLVPTMGALHEGHLSLVNESKRNNDATIVSIYVNPKQFGPNEDLSKYPRDLEGDIAKLEAAGVDCVFLPSDEIMYQAGYCTNISVEGLNKKLCGFYRPSHFDGVATVVAKLFNICRPTNAYFGQKDYQQTLIIKRFVKDLNMNVNIIICPIIREPSGLALSSRNAYLSPEEKKAATIIFKALSFGDYQLKKGEQDISLIKHEMQAMIKEEPLITEIQYCSIYDTETLEEIEQINTSALLAIALKIGNTRLIDNMLFYKEKLG